MKTAQLKQLALATALATTTALAGETTTAIALDPGTPLEEQGWKTVGGIAPEVKELDGQKILVLDDQSDSEAAGCIATIPADVVAQALERGFAVSVTMRWEGKPLAHNIQVMVGENRIFLTLHNTGKEQCVSTLPRSKQSGGRISDPRQFHTWRLVWKPDGRTELYADGQKVTEGFELLKTPKRATGSFGIGGIHGTAKKRTGRLEIAAATFEILGELQPIK